MSDPPARRSHAFWWLCVHWFCAMGALGILFPYLALFLRENVGLTTTQVGVVLAIPPIVGALAQPAWGHVADRTGSRVPVLLVLAAGTAVGYVALAHATALGTVVMATVLFALFHTSLVPIATSVTFGALPSPTLFGRIRVWGTIGYLVLVVSAPALLQARRAALGIVVDPSGPSEPGLEQLFLLAAALTAAAALSTLPLRGQHALTERAERGDLRVLLANKEYVRVLVFSMGAQLWLNGPMQLFPLYVRSRGGTLGDVSRMWLWMLLLEAPMIFGSSWLFRRFGVARVQTAAVAAGGLRWVVCASLPALTYAYPVQLLHALMITGTLVGTALHVEQIVPARLRSTAQAAVTMAGASIGGVLSSVLGGAIVDRFGIDLLYFAFGSAGLAWAAGWWRPLALDQWAPGRLNRAS